MIKKSALSSAVFFALTASVSSHAMELVYSGGRVLTLIGNGEGEVFERDNIVSN